MAAVSSFTATAASSSNRMAVPAVSKPLILGAYRRLLKESQFFDRRPLAKAFLSASPYLRKDNSWVSVVNQTQGHPTDVANYCGIASNTLSMPSNRSMTQFVRDEFRNANHAWDPVRFFGWIRRLDLAKQLHERCSVSLPPSLPEVKPKLQLVETSSMKTCSPGMMLFAHPVLVDDFIQAAVLITDCDKERAVGIAINSPSGEAEFILTDERLRALLPKSIYTKVKSRNVKYFSPWTVHNGGQVSSMPVVLHRSKAVAKALTKMPAAVKKVVDDSDSLPCGKIHGEWRIDPLAAVLTLDPALVRKELKPDAARIVMNHSHWETPQVIREVVQNWWLATDKVSSTAALSSLLQYPEMETDRMEGGSSHLWQRAVSNLGGHVGDFARLSIIEEEHGDFRKLITRTFKDDLRQQSITSTTSSSDHHSDDDHDDDDE